MQNSSDKKLVQGTLTAVKRDNTQPCKSYQPVSDWKHGEPAPDCVCGRPRRPSHTPGAILKGVKQWRDKHPLKSVCGHFIGSITTPGTCSVCDKKWIEHSKDNRGLVIEAFSDFHHPACKCIIQNGDVQCSCMTEHEIQTKLDELGSGKENEVVCKQFKSKSRGTTICECGNAFYLHSNVARDGANSFSDWRSSHMGDDELLEWFQSLPGLGTRGERITTGQTRGERTKFLESLLADPKASYTPPFTLANPDGTTMLALLETLDGGALHRVKQRMDNTIEATVVHKQDLPLNQEEEPEVARKYLCHSCNEMDSDTPGQYCESCNDFLRTQSANGPVLRMGGS